jgi:hypothetical protein
MICTRFTSCNGEAAVVLRVVILGVQDDALVEVVIVDFVRDDETIPVYYLCYHLKNLKCLNSIGCCCTSD